MSNDRWFIQHKVKSHWFSKHYHVILFLFSLITSRPSGLHNLQLLSSSKSPPGPYSLSQSTTSEKNLNNFSKYRKDPKGLSLFFQSVRNPQNKGLILNNHLQNLIKCSSIIHKLKCRIFSLKWYELSAPLFTLGVTSLPVSDLYIRCRFHKGFYYMFSVIKSQFFFCSLSVYL